MHSGDENCTLSKNSDTLTNTNDNQSNIRHKEKELSEMHSQRLGNAKECELRLRHEQELADLRVEEDQQLHERQSELQARQYDRARLENRITQSQHRMSIKQTPPPEPRTAHDTTTADIISALTSLVGQKYEREEHEKPPKFKGESHEDSEEWLRQFEKIAEFNGWSDAKKLRALPLYLEGPAGTWYDEQPQSTKVSYATAITALREEYHMGTMRRTLKGELATRKQQDNESLDQYTDDIIRRCRRLHVSPQDKLDYFIQGLRHDLHDYVNVNQPKTFEEARKLAKIKDTTSKTNKGDKGLDELKTLVKTWMDQHDRVTPTVAAHMVTREDLERDRPVVAAGHDPTHPPPQCDNAIDSIRGELQRMNYQLQTLINNQQGQSSHQTYYPSYNCYDHNYYSDDRFQSSYWPQQGVKQRVSCNYCKKPGHHIRECRKRLYNNNKRQVGFSDDVPGVHSLKARYKTRQSFTKHYTPESHRKTSSQASHNKTQYATSHNIPHKTRKIEATRTKNAPVNSTKLLKPSEVKSSLIVPGKLFGHEVDILVDTGADITLISDVFIQQIQKGRLLQIEESDVRAIKTLDREIPITNKVNISINIGTVCYDWMAYVASIPASVLVLGSDFLRTHKALVDFRNDTLKFMMTEPVKMKMQRDSVRIATCIAVPRQSEAKEQRKGQELENRQIHLSTTEKTNTSIQEMMKPIFNGVNVNEDPVTKQKFKNPEIRVHERKSKVSNNRTTGKAIEGSIRHQKKKRAGPKRSDLKKEKWDQKTPKHFDVGKKKNPLKVYALKSTTKSHASLPILRFVLTTFSWFLAMLLFAQLLSYGIEEDYPMPRNNFQTSYPLNTEISFPWMMNTFKLRKIFDGTATSTHQRHITTDNDITKMTTYGNITIGKEINRTMSFGKLTSKFKFR